VIGVRDGDTFVLLDNSKVQHVIRPAGCNTPERGQPFYQKAKQSLSEMIYGKQVVVDVSKLDKWERKVGIARVDGLDVCLEQIRRASRAFQQFEREQSQEDREAFSAAESEARTAGAGLWKVRARSDAD
jgi:endonuclease YncB( thermonuclease family)